MKKIIASMLTVFILFAILCVNSYAAGVSVSSIPSGTKVGDEITLTVTCPATNGFEAPVTLKGLQYVSGNVSGGMVTLANKVSVASFGGTFSSFTLTFKVISDGDLKFTIGSGTTFDAEGEPVNSPELGNAVSGSTKTYHIKTSAEIVAEEAAKKAEEEAKAAQQAQQAATEAAKKAEEEAKAAEQAKKEAAEAAKTTKNSNTSSKTNSSTSTSGNKTTSTATENTKTAEQQKNEVSQPETTINEVANETVNEITNQTLTNEVTTNEVKNETIEASATTTESDDSTMKIIVFSVAGVLGLIFIAVIVYKVKNS